jgi:hypothetical protein
LNDINRAVVRRAMNARMSNTAPAKSARAVRRRERHPRDLPSTAMREKQKGGVGAWLSLPEVGWLTAHSKSHVFRTAMGVGIAAGQQSAE